MKLYRNINKKIKAYTLVEMLLTVFLISLLTSASIIAFVDTSKSVFIEKAYEFEGLLRYSKAYASINNCSIYLNFINNNENIEIFKETNESIEKLNDFPVNIQEITDHIKIQEVTINNNYIENEENPTNSIIFYPDGSMQDSARIIITSIENINDGYEFDLFDSSGIIHKISLTDIIVDEEDINNTVEEELIYLPDDSSDIF